MPRVIFTTNLKRHVDCSEQVVRADTVRAALEVVFSGSPGLRSYLLDDQGHLRQHVLVFVDGELVKDRVGLADRLRPESEICVMQALSGGSM